jgi:hypothetical protein
MDNCQQTMDNCQQTMDNKQLSRLMQGHEAGQWTGRELNPRHMDFQSIALPTELPVLQFPICLEHFLGARGTTAGVYLMDVHTM